MKAFGIELGGGAAQQPLVVGGLPSADLLPPEVRLARRSRGIRRGVVAAAVLVLVVAGAGAAAAKAQSLVAEAQLAAGEARTIELLQQQAAFVELTAVQAEIDERTAARAVVTSSEIAWPQVIAAIRGMLPDGTALTTISVEGAPPMEAYAQASAPLQGARIATVTFTAVGPSADAAPSVLDALAGLEGFVDGHVPSRTGVEGLVETTFVLHLDAGALAGRFPPPEPAAPPAEPLPGTEAQGATEEGNS